MLPSFTDLRARFGEPGFEYRETVASGLRAAAAGGYGAVCVLPDCDPVADDATVIEAIHNHAERANSGELLPIGALTHGLKGKELAEYGSLKNVGVVALSDADGFVSKASLMRRIFEYALTFDLLVMQQPTDPSLAEDTVMHEGAVSVRLGLRGCPSTAEHIALERDLALVRETGARYHASALSTKEAVAAIARAKAEGLSVTADVAVANLVWTDADVAHYESSYRVVPPLRDRTHQDALLEGLETGTLDAVSSNHSPRSTLEKSGEFDLSASGMTSLETTLSSLWALHEAGRMSLRTLIRSLVEGPSRVLHRESPRLVEGAAASFTLIDPSRSWTPSGESLLSKSWNTPLLGQSLRGKVLMTLHRGAILYQDACLQHEPSRNA